MLATPAATAPPGAAPALPPAGAAAAPAARPSGGTRRRRRPAATPSPPLTAAPTRTRRARASSPRSGPGKQRAWTVLTLASLAGFVALYLLHTSGAWEALRPSTAWSDQGIENFRNAFDDQLCCQDHVLHRFLPQLQSRVTGLVKPLRPLTFALVGGTGTGKSHTLQLLAKTVYGEGKHISEIMTRSESKASIARKIARIEAQVRKHPESLINVEEMHLASPELLHFFRHATKVSAAGKFRGVDYTRATFAFTLNSPRTYGELADVLYGHMTKTHRAGAEALGELDFDEWGPRVTAVFANSTKGDLSFLMNADTLIPFWPMDDTCVKCACNKRVLREAAARESTGRMVKLHIGDGVCEQITECQPRHEAWGRKFSENGANGVEQHLDYCLDAVSDRFNPLGYQGWSVLKQHDWHDRHVLLAATGHPKALCKNTRKHRMCWAHDRRFSYQIDMLKNSPGAGAPPAADAPRSTAPPARS